MDSYAKLWKPSKRQAHRQLWRIWSCARPRLPSSDVLILSAGHIMEAW